MIPSKIICLHSFFPTKLLSLIEKITRTGKKWRQLWLIDHWISTFIFLANVSAHTFALQFQNLNDTAWNIRI